MLTILKLILLLTNLHSIVRSSSITATTNVINALFETDVSLQWQVKVDINSENTRIFCYAFDNSPRDLVIGRPTGDSRFQFQLNEEAKDFYGDRINVTFDKEIMSDLIDYFSITIKGVKFTDEKAYFCEYGESRAYIRLNVVLKLKILMSDLTDKLKVNTEKLTAIVWKMCGKPRPKLTLYFEGRKEEIKGSAINIDNCYHYEHNLFTPDPKVCGTQLKYSIEDYNNTKMGYSTLTMDLKPLPVKEVIIKKSHETKVFKITWTGPNIGLCTIPMYYQLKIETSKHERIYNVTSNVFELRTEPDDHFVTCFVRTNMQGNFSSWVNGQFIVAEKPVDFRRRVIIIVTTILMISLLMIACGVLWFKHIHRTNNNGGVMKYSSLEKLNDNNDEKYCSDKQGKLYALQKQNGEIKPRAQSLPDQKSTPLKRPKESISSEHSVFSDKKKDLAESSIPKRPTFTEIKIETSDKTNKNEVYETMVAGSPDHKSLRTSDYDQLHKSREKIRNTTSVSSCPNEYVPFESTDYNTETEYDRLERQSNGTRHSSLGSRSSASSGATRPSLNIPPSPQNVVTNLPIPNATPLNDIDSDKNYLKPDAGMRGRLDSGDYNIIDSRSTSQTSLYASIPNNGIEPGEPGDTIHPKGIIPPEQIYDVIPRSNSINSNTQEVNSSSPLLNNNLNETSKNFDQYVPVNMEAIYDTSPSNKEAIYDVVPKRSIAVPYDSNRAPYDSNRGNEITTTASMTENPMEDLYANVSELIKR